MADIKSAEERSRNMAAIKSKNTSPELFLRHLLHSNGYRYRLYTSHIPGHPDIWMRKYNTAIFVHGCFWHRHEGCKYAYMPKSRLEFWADKFERNVHRDEEVRKELESANIRCLVVWEYTINRARKKKAKPEDLMKEIESFLNSEACYKEL